MTALTQPSTPQHEGKCHSTMKPHVIQPSVKTLEALPFNVLKIPPYQRPYKWTARNVNQLINDLIAFRNKQQYRLGTLVLHQCDIVDGQQRIITLTLLIKKLFEKVQDDRKRSAYANFMAKMNQFMEETKFFNRDSLHNIVENIHVIETREADLEEGLLDFLLTRCEFVVIELSDISEAFQFFDSQNARGKDLAPHDLLKAYHLREINQLSEADSKNVDQWQRQQTERLEEIFLTLFRAKLWSQGKSARYFTKKQIGTFKGISIHNRKRYPFYQLEIIAHIFTEIYSNDPMRLIDRNLLEYPFNLDDQIINGSRFFDMIRHYMQLYSRVLCQDSYSQGTLAHEIMLCIYNYEGTSRTGDCHVKKLFFTTLLYYIDRFGWEEMDKVVPKIFIWAYKLRLTKHAVQAASIDNYATETYSMLRLIHDAQTPYDLININQEGVTTKSIAATKCDKIKTMFQRFNKLYDHE